MPETTCDICGARKSPTENWLGPVCRRDSAQGVADCYASGYGYEKARADEADAVLYQLFCGISSSHALQGACNVNEEAYRTARLWMRRRKVP